MVAAFYLNETDDHLSASQEMVTLIVIAHPIPGDGTDVLTAYRQRNLPQIHGVLRSVTADSLVDGRTGQPYFLAKVEIDRASSDTLGGVQMVPGMPAEVMLLSGELTLLDHMISPVTDSLTHSLREH